ncbi:MAG TPA: RNA-binding domain-containing protein [Solirubrobacteraceae bacterium]|nr:RNA-binding domain-containing protein [Solirubrobacteraceae bacterium]
MALVLADLLTAHESSKVEFKRDTSGLQGIVREAIAFANRTGGVILVGVDDKSREVVGVDDPQRAEQQIAQAVYDSTVPPLAPDIVVTTDPSSGNEVVLVQVHRFQGPDPVMHTDGSCYERISSSKKKVGPERVEAMRTERRGRSSFDQLPAMAATMDDLDLDDARGRYAERGIDLDDGLIRTFEIAEEVNGELVPTNGGLLLFGRKPQKVHPDAICLCARFRGTRKGADIMDQDEIRAGSMLTILDRMDAFIDRNNPTASVVRGRQRDNFRHYDPIIIREALNNAIAHADYSVDGARFHVHILDDRLVIESPGTWVTGIDADDVRAGHSKTRNRAITRNLHELDLIEERGSFWGKVLTAHEERGYPLPAFEDVGHSLRVIIPIHPAAAKAETAPAATESDKTPARQRMPREERYAQFEQFLAEGPRSTAQIAKLADMTTRGAREILQEMLGGGRVIVSDHPPNSPRRVWSVNSELD